MSRSEHILEQLGAELGFASHLVGGVQTVLAQIDRFLLANRVPENLDLPSHPTLWHRLIAEVVVPETSFFRYPESFFALREFAITQLHRSTRILCLPCSTGEEAWSIAMTLREVGADNFRIDAADASPRSVLHAESGRYATRSIRGLPPAQRRRWFDSEDNSLVVKSELRRFVDFRAADALSFHAEPQSYEVIFCRNLLIYFDEDNQRRLFDRLAHWLHPEGVLFLGPGEATVAASHGWKGTGRAMSFSFARGISTPPLPKRSPPPGRKSAPLLSVVPGHAKPRPAKAEAPGEIDWLERANEFANAGQSAEAATALEKHHASQAPSPESLLLRGILEEAEGNRAQAEADYRRTLYLDPDHHDALLHLALLLENDGRISAALPFRRRLDRLSIKS